MSAFYSLMGVSEGKERVIEITYTPLSTPLWEFPIYASKRSGLEKLCDFLLPYGSFLTPPQSLSRRSLWCSLSTPLWEFQVRRRAEELAAGAAELSTPLWEFLLLILL